VYDPAGNRLSEHVDGSVNGGTFNGLNQLTGRSSGGQILLEGTISKPSTVSVGGSNVAVNAKNFKTKINVSTGTNNISIVATDANNVSTSKTAQIVVTGTASQNFSYDDNGNLLSDGSRTFTWDACNRLKSIRYGSDLPRTEFAYDGQNRRVQIKEISTSGTSNKNLLWSGNQIAEERDGGNNATKRYYTCGMQLVGTSTANYFYTFDHLGSIREVTDNAGTLKTRYAYDPYGRKTAAHVAGNIDSDFGYTGHYYHAPSALCLTLYRAYDADTARWLSRDPIGEEGGLNLYGYVADNPVNRIDPLGLRSAMGAGKITIDPKCNDSVRSMFQYIPEDPPYNLTPLPKGTVDADAIYVPGIGWAQKIPDNMHFYIDCDCKGNFKKMRSVKWPWWMGQSPEWNRGEPQPPRWPGNVTP